MDIPHGSATEPQRMPSDTEPQSGTEQKRNHEDSSATEQPPHKKTKFGMECNIMLDAGKYGNHLRTNTHKVNVTSVTDDENVRLLQTAFRNRLVTYQLVNAEPENINIALFLGNVREKFKTLVRQCLNKHTIVRVAIELFAEYFLEKNDSTSIKSFNTKSVVVSRNTDLDECYDSFSNSINVKSMEFSERDSGWAIVRILNVELSVAKFDSCGDAGGTYIPLPYDIVRKKAVLNIKNTEDNECFRWCILAHLHPVNHGSHGIRVSKYREFINELNFTGIEFPVKLKDIAKFERLNDTISVKVYGLRKSAARPPDFRKHSEIIGPLYYTPVKRANHINLLVIEDSVSHAFHYTLITGISRLMSSTVSAHEHAKYLCDGCLNWFATPETYAKHTRYDCDHVVCVVPTTNLLPDKYGRLSHENKLKFTQYEKSLKIPFVIYYDFETILCKIDTCQQSTDVPFTNKTHHHVPHSFAYYIKCSFDDTLSSFKTYRGRDAAKKFVEYLHEDAKYLFREYLHDITPMRPLTPEENILFTTATHCFICKKPFTADDESTNYRVRHHDHLTGDFVAGCHLICNLLYKIPHFIPCVAHNSSSYDTSLFIRELAEACNHDDNGEEETITVIPQTKEQYITFSKSIKIDHKQFVTLRFIDSFRFMAASLDTLASNLSDEECAHIAEYFPVREQFELMRKKGVFPYTFVDTYDKLNCTTALPAQHEFFDDLKQRPVIDAEYERAKHIWDAFKCKNLGEYSDLYLKVDVLLLTDIMEAFRKVCLQTYDLDPFHFVTAPGLSWVAMLKYTDIELELLTDLEMIHFLRRGIRGGICQCNVRKSTANNAFLADTFDPTQDTSYLLYLDVTNLYGWAMTQPLPISDFKFIDQWDADAILSTPADSDVGYILEVDLHYPNELHDGHNDLPFCAESFVPPTATKSKLTKLCTTLCDKTKYVIHYRTLQQALGHGLQLTKIHRVLQFKQRAWLKPYIDLNTQLRCAATTKFNKDFFKLLINSIFGKALEAVHKRVDVKLLTKWLGRYGAGRRVLSPYFKNFTIFAEDFVAVQLHQSRIVYNKPNYIGFAVLEVSKLNMYAFLYDHLKRRYMEHVVLLYMDTDSFLIKIYTENVYKDLMADAHMYDLSNYPVGNVHDIPPSASVIGRMKDEYGGRIIREFLGTGAKAYCVDVKGSELTKKAKGVKRNVVEDDITRDDYNYVVCTAGAKIYRTMRSIRRFQHRIYTIYLNKVSLSYFDDKRRVDDASFNTLAWGHCKIPQ